MSFLSFKAYISRGGFLVRFFPIIVFIVFIGGEEYFFNPNENQIVVFAMFLLISLYVLLISIQRMNDSGVRKSLNFIFLCPLIILPALHIFFNIHSINATDLFELVSYSVIYSHIRVALYIWMIISFVILLILPSKEIHGKK